MKKFYTAWGRHNQFMISETPLEDNPLVAFTFGVIEAENKQEAEQKSKEIFAKRFKTFIERKLK